MRGGGPCFRLGTCCRLPTDSPPRAALRQRYSSESQSSSEKISPFKLFFCFITLEP